MKITKKKNYKMIKKLRHCALSLQELTSHSKKNIRNKKMIIKNNTQSLLIFNILNNPLYFILNIRSIYIKYKGLLRI